MFEPLELLIEKPEVVGGDFNELSTLRVSYRGRLLLRGSISSVFVPSLFCAAFPDSDFDGLFFLVAVLRIVLALNTVG